MFVFSTFVIFHQWWWHFAKSWFWHVKGQNLERKLWCLQLYHNFLSRFLDLWCLLSTRRAAEFISSTLTKIFNLPSLKSTLSCLLIVDIALQKKTWETTCTSRQILLKHVSVSLVVHFFWCNCNLVFQSQKMTSIHFSIMNGRNSDRKVVKLAIASHLFRFYQG